jgi:hypothetical protein
MLLSCSVSKNRTEKSNLLILGTLHSGGKKINSNSIYEVLVNFKPDIILLEVESDLFERENILKSSFDGSDNNEFLAVLRYQKDHPNVQLKPAELENKNVFRKNLGIYSEAGFVFNKIQELDSLNKLNDKEKSILLKLNRYDNLVNKIANEDLRVMNSQYSDNTVDSLMHYQYHEIKKIVNNHSDFEKYRLISSKKDTISFKDYFNNWADFEGILRNEGIANNVIKYHQSNPTKRIILLTGFKHRFFVRKYLLKNNIKTIEFK